MPLERSFFDFAASRAWRFLSSLAVVCSGVSLGYATSSLKGAAAGALAGPPRDCKRGKRIYPLQKCRLLTASRPLYERSKRRSLLSSDS